MGMRLQLLARTVLGLTILNCECSVCTRVYISCSSCYRTMSGVALHVYKLQARIAFGRSLDCLVDIPVLELVGGPTMPGLRTGQSITRWPLHLVFLVCLGRLGQACLRAPTHIY